MRWQRFGCSWPRLCENGLSSYPPPTRAEVLMPCFVEGSARDQVTLLPECLDDYITEDNRSEWSMRSLKNSIWASSVSRA